MLMMISVCQQSSGTMEVDFKSECPKSQNWLKGKSTIRKTLGLQTLENQKYLFCIFFALVSHFVCHLFLHLFVIFVLRCHFLSCCFAVFCHFGFGNANEMQRKCKINANKMTPNLRNAKKCETNANKMIPNLRNAKNM